MAEGLVSSSFLPIPATLGISADFQHGLVTLATVSCHHDPSFFVPSVWHTSRISLPAPLLESVRSWNLEPTTPVERRWISDQFSELLAQGIEHHRNQEKNSAVDTLLAVIHGGEVWQVGVSHRSIESLVQPEMLAEATGLTVLDDLPGRDLAQGGPGGPVEAPGYWLLLGDRTPLPGIRYRGLLEMGATWRLVVVPPLECLEKRFPLAAFDIGPGSQLLNEVLFKFSGDPNLDPAKLAVQGKSIPELLERWQAMLGEILAPWHPFGVNSLPLVYAAFNLARELNLGIGLPDLLSTSARLMTDRLVLSVAELARRGLPVGELLLHGPGCEDGLFLQLLQRRLSGTVVQPWSAIAAQDHLNFPNVVRTTSDGLVAASTELSADSRMTQSRESRAKFPSTSLYLTAAAVACLGLLHLWQVPISYQEGTIPRIPGRLTPGKPVNWRAVLQLLNANLPWMLPLREAI